MSFARPEGHMLVVEAVFSVNPVVQSVWSLNEKETT
jgi:hypothetical protein